MGVVTSHGRLLAGVLLAVAAGAIAVAVGVALLLGGIIDLRGSADSALHSDGYLVRVIDVERSVVDAETGLRGYVITGQPLFLAPLRRAQQQLPPEATALAQMAASQHAFTGQADALAAAARAYMSGYVATLLGQMATDPAAARTLAATLQGKRVVDNIRTRTAALEGLVSGRQASREHAAHESADRAVGEGIVVLVLLTLLTALLGGILGRLLVGRERARERAALLAEASVKLDRAVTVVEALECFTEIADGRLTEACLARALRGDEAAPGARATSGDAELIALGEGEAVDAALARTRGAAGAANSEALVIPSPRGPVQTLVISCRVRGRLAADALLLRGGAAWGPGEIAEACELGSRMALAVHARSLQAETATLLSRAGRTARTLQQSLLPRAMPSIQSCELAVRFSPAGEGDLVGGDFYDAFAVGRDRWAIVVGDVCGKGAEAAALTAMARWTLRSLAGAPVAPADALRSLNDAMLRQDLGGRFITVAYLLVHVRPDEAHITVACGGHPPPVLVPTGGDPAALPAHGDLIGVWPDLRVHSADVRLGSGESLVVYTDGVTDQGPDPRPTPEQALRDQPPNASAADLAEALERQALRPRHQRDDVAIVALRFTGGRSAAGRPRRRRPRRRRPRRVRAGRGRPRRAAVRRQRASAASAAAAAAEPPAGHAAGRRARWRPGRRPNALRR